MAKYEKGRKCLVLHSFSRPDIIGSTIILGDWYQSWWDISTEKIVQGKCWEIDPPILDSNDGGTIVFLEPWLLPLDDDNINKELRDELLEVKPIHLVPA